MTIQMVVDYSPVLTWSGELTSALVVLVVVAFIIGRIR